MIEFFSLIREQTEIVEKFSESSNGVTTFHSIYLFRGEKLPSKMIFLSVVRWGVLLNTRNVIKFQYEQTFSSIALKTQTVLQQWRPETFRLNSNSILYLLSAYLYVYSTSLLEPLGIFSNLVCLPVKSWFWIPAIPVGAPCFSIPCCLSIMRIFSLLKQLQSHF